MRELEELTNQGFCIHFCRRL